MTPRHLITLVALTFSLAACQPKTATTSTSGAASSSAAAATTGKAGASPPGSAATTTKPVPSAAASSSPSPSPADAGSSPMTPMARDAAALDRLISEGMIREKTCHASATAGGVAIGDSDWEFIDGQINMRTTGDGLEQVAVDGAFFIRTSDGSNGPWSSWERFDSIPDGEMDLSPGTWLGDVGEMATIEHASSAAGQTYTVHPDASSNLSDTTLTFELNNRGLLTRMAASGGMTFEMLFSRWGQDVHITAPVD